jgi:hypothetical protein
MMPTAHISLQQCCWAALPWRNFPSTPDSRRLRCATSAPAPLWLETSSPKLKQALRSAATTKVQASSILGPPLGVFMVSYQRYEGDISITLCETCRTQTLCPVNMKYLQGRERVCVLNVCSMDLILSVTGVAVSTCFSICIYLLFLFCFMFPYWYMCLYVNYICRPSNPQVYLSVCVTLVGGCICLMIWMCTYVCVYWQGFQLVHLLLVVPSPQKCMFKRVSHTMEPRSPITLVDRMFHNL